jgi:hypothetical protein
MSDLLVLDGNASASVPFTVVDGAAMIAAGDLDAALGWTLKPEGLCRGDVCVPLRDQTIGDADQLDVATVARALGQPIVVDSARGVAAIGTAASTRIEQMASLQAPAFSLPRISAGDDDGELVSLADFDRRKVLLLAWSSW